MTRRAPKGSDNLPGSRAGPVVYLQSGHMESRGVSMSSDQACAGWPARVCGERPRILAYLPSVWGARAQHAGQVFEAVCYSNEVSLTVAVIFSVLGFKPSVSSLGKLSDALYSTCF